MATMASRYFNIQIEQKRHRNGKAGLRQQGEIVAPMPARVIVMHVVPGENVTSGQPLVLLESMKMQMEIKSPIDGIVEAVFVDTTGQVEKGSGLVVVRGATQ